MNFLQLTQRLRQECGVAGTGPLTTVGQVGQAKKLVDWVAAAWLEIQGLHDTWAFMREPFSFNTTANVGDYLPADAGLTDLRYWHKDTLRLQKTSIGVQDEQWLVEWEYQVFRNTYRFNVQTPNRPMVFAVKPNGKALMLGPAPDDVYTVMGEYQTVPVPFVNDTDEPNLQEHEQMIIVYKAMQYYGMYESAPEVLSRGQGQYQALLAQLQREQLETPYLGNPLA